MRKKEKIGWGWFDENGNLIIGFGREAEEKGYRVTVVKRGEDLAEEELIELIEDTKRALSRGR